MTRFSRYCSSWDRVPRSTGGASAGSNTVNGHPMECPSVWLCNRHSQRWQTGKRRPQVEGCRGQNRRQIHAKCACFDRQAFYNLCLSENTGVYVFEQRPPLLTG